MTDLGNHNFNQGAQDAQAAPREVGASAAPAAKSVAQAHDDSSECARLPIGVVLEIAGSGSQIAIDLQRLNECLDDAEDRKSGVAGKSVSVRVNLGGRRA